MDLSLTCRQCNVNQQITVFNECTCCLAIFSVIVTHSAFVLFTQYISSWSTAFSGAKRQNDVNRVNVFF